MEGISSAAHGPSLAQVCNFWKEFDLGNYRSKLDEVALMVAEYQEESMASRKMLAEDTKEFKKSAGDGMVKGVRDLLKQYQKEVDKLTKRAKHSEAAYLEVYEKLYEAPDPYESLSAGLESGSRISELESKVRKQAQELAEFRAEAKEIQNQDLTIRRLEDKVRNLENEVELKNTEIEKARVEASQGIKEDLMMKEARLQTMLKESQESLEAMRKLHQASEDRIFAIKSETEEEKAGYRSELDIAVSEVERAQERVLALEAEKNQLSLVLKAQQDGTNVETSTAPASSADDGLVAELVKQRDLNASLNSDLAQLKKELEESREGGLIRLNAMKETAKAQEAHVEALEAELGARPSAQQVEDLKHQISLLQAVQFNSAVDGELFSSDSGEKDLLQGSMERMLLQKNRKLEHDLTMCKLKEVELKQSLDTAHAQVSDLQSDLEEQKQLVIGLEEDLLSAQNSLANSSQSIAAPVLRIGQTMDEDDGSQKMIEVLQNQRDRARQKVEEMQKELSTLQLELANMHAELAASQADNVALVERIQFLQGYRKEHAAKDIESGTVAENKYLKEYEQKMNPFTEFQGRQREKRKKQLNIIDKTVLNAGDLLFGNRYARLFVFAYVVLMHMLVAPLVIFSSHGHGPAHLMVGEEARQFCREHIQCTGGVMNLTNL